MSNHSIARSPSAARAPRAFGHDPEPLSSGPKPIFTKAQPGPVLNRDAGPIRSWVTRHIFRRGSDEVFYPNNASRQYQPPSHVARRAGILHPVNGQVATVERHARERELLAVPAAQQYIAPYEVQVQLPNGPHGRVFVSPLRAIDDPRLPPGTIVSSAIDPKISYF